MSQALSYIKQIEAQPSPRIVVQHPKCYCEISLFGGQLLSFTPADAEDIIWRSNEMNLSGNKPLRGGAPLCWPWFGPAIDKDKPQHGYIRAMTWQVCELSETADKVIVELCPPAAELSALGVNTQVKVRYEISKQLSISLISLNLSDEPSPLSQAIHTYFAVEDIMKVRVTGLENTRYLDQLSGTTEVQEQPIQIGAETDRIYHTQAPSIILDDQNRKIEVQSSGHDSIVVWNPWTDKAAAMNDFDDDGYQRMLCLETASTNSPALAPNSRMTLTQTIKLLET